MRLSDLLSRVEKVQQLDKGVAALRSLAEQVLGPRELRDVLHGTKVLGHPLHPVLVQVPLGAWLSASLLDLVRPRTTGSAARTLVGAGVLAAVPTALAGLADFNAAMDPHADRAGVVHAGANTGALAFFATSYAARRVGAHGTGRSLALAGLGLAAVGGLIGGHLAYRMGIGVDHTLDDPPPSAWTPVGMLDELPDGEPVMREAAGVPIFLLREGYQVRALVDRCSHLAGPLHEGQLSQVDGVTCITCPWHMSMFRVDDGMVVHGPATAPQPVLEVRVVDKKVEVRASH